MGSCFGTQKDDPEAEQLLPSQEQVGHTPQRSAVRSSPPPSLPRSLPHSIPAAPKSRMYTPPPVDTSKISTKQRQLIEELNGLGPYRITMEELCLGGRLQKYWCRGTMQDNTGQIMVTMAPLPRRCALDMKKSCRVLNDLLENLRKNPLLHPIYEIRSHDNRVVIIQPLMSQGSLRDVLHKVDDPTKDWALKYKEKGKLRMDDGEIALCGRSILEALKFLYSHHFPPMGHIQTGNIFKTREGYKLGGFENMLLGYKSRYHHLCQQFGGDNIDIIMLGHVIYEMGSGGRELASIVPEDDDPGYKHVRSKEVVSVLRLIFNKVYEEDYENSLEQILNDPFFAYVQENQLPLGYSYEIELSGKERALLKEVKEGKQVQQGEVKTEDPKEEFVDVMNYYLTKRNYPSISTNDIKFVGTHRGKAWVKVRTADTPLQLLSAAKVSADCPIILTDICLNTIRSFFQNLKHPRLFPVDAIKYYDGKVLILQQFKKKGSLRDSINKSNPWQEWSEKNRGGKILSEEDIRNLSRQILEGCSVLYGMGFPQLGHIQMGNIFLEEGKVCLTGFENTLLGYSTANSETLHQYQPLDRVMFGHVVYEMGSGAILASGIPSEEEYRKVKDKNVREFLRDIFEGVVGKVETAELDPDPGKWIKDLTRSGKFLGGNITHVEVEVPEAMADILRSVQAGKKRKQWIASMGGALKKGARKVKGAFKKVYEKVMKHGDSSTN